MARRTYSDEFRRRAVEQYESTAGATLSSVAKDFGIPRSTLSAWVARTGGTAAHVVAEPSSEDRGKSDGQDLRLWLTVAGFALSALSAAALWWSWSMLARVTGAALAISVLIVVDFLRPRGWLRAARMHRPRWVTILAGLAVLVYPIGVAVASTTTGTTTVLLLAAITAVAVSTLVSAATPITIDTAFRITTFLVAGVACLLFCVDNLREGDLLVSVVFLLLGGAGLLLGAENLQLGVESLRPPDLRQGWILLVGVACLLFGLACLEVGYWLFGVALLLVNVVCLLIGVANPQVGERMFGLVCLLFGVAGLLCGLACLQVGYMLVSVAFLLFGLAGLLTGVASLRNSKLVGVVFLLSGVAGLLVGVAFLWNGEVLSGVVCLLFGVAGLLSWVVFMLDDTKTILVRIRTWLTAPISQFGSADDDSPPTPGSS